MAMLKSLQRYRRQLLGTGTLMLGWVSVSYLPNTYGVPYMKQLLSGFGKTELSPSTQALIDQVVLDLNASRSRDVRTKKLEFIQIAIPFPEVTMKGGGHTGAIIVLPQGFSVSNRKELKLKPPVDADSDSVDFCLLSDNAKKFTIARSIVYSEDYSISFRTCLGLVMIAAWSAIGVKLNEHFSNPTVMHNTIDNARMMLMKNKKVFSEQELIEKSMGMFRSMQVVRLGILTVALVNIYWAALYWNNHRVERNADTTVGKLGKDYINGGAEYYNKLLLSNVFRKTHYGAEFTDTGNSSEGWIHSKNLSLTSRWYYFEGLKES